MGTKDMDFIQLNQLIGRKTGGISVYPLTSSVRGKIDPCMRMIARGKAMAGQVEDLFNLVCYFVQQKCLHIGTAHFLISMSGYALSVISLLGKHF